MLKVLAKSKIWRCQARGAHIMERRLEGSPCPGHPIKLNIARGMTQLFGSQSYKKLNN